MKSISARWRCDLAVAAFCAVVSGGPDAAAADVLDRSAGGFTLKTTVRVAAPPDRVYRALVDIGSWWGKGHTYSGDSRNMTIDARPGGCFCETLPNGGGVEHGRVVYVAPGTLLRITSALGPLQAMGLAGSWTWQIAPAGEESTLTMTYAVGGYAPGGLEALAPVVDQVLSEQVGYLKAHAEKSN